MPPDRRAEAGRRAEEQMTFYLRRAFGDTANLAILHDLRLVRSDQHLQDAAQIDHLVIHPGGLIIVESKSVSTRVRCDAHGHWTRHVPGHGSQGMPSPIIQARNQGAFLRRYLASAWPTLTQDWHGSVLVAFSDHGRVDYDGESKEIALAQRAVCKADQAPDRVRALVQKAVPLPATDWDPSSVKQMLASHACPLVVPPTPFSALPFAEEFRAMFGADTAKLFDALLGGDMIPPRSRRRKRRRIRDDDDDDDDADGDDD